MSFRPVSLNVSSISQADSSSIIKIGNSAVTCGIKAVINFLHSQMIVKFKKIN